MSIIGAILDIAGAVTQEAIAKNQGDTIKELKQEVKTWRTRATKWEKENAELRNALITCSDRLTQCEAQKMDLRDQLNATRRDRDVYYQQVVAGKLKPAPLGELDDTSPSPPEESEESHEQG